MRILVLIFVYFLMVLPNRQVDSPHGPDFKMSCSDCHSSKSWELDTAVYSFDHNTTPFPLTGQHVTADCRQCHPTLVFRDAKTECSSCHSDQHQGTVGLDCARCHKTRSWLVDNINEIHQSSRFPLLGAHRTADCLQCHKSENHVRFDVPGIQCVDCHREDYASTTNPNHITSGISDDCLQCHKLTSLQWAGAGYNHNFFPLVLGHSGPKCTDCHLTSNYRETSAECSSCHLETFNATKEPNHTLSGISQNCSECHNLNPGWKPATFDHSKFPLTLGHKGPICSDCHKTEDYKSTSTECYSCHQQDFNSVKDPDHIASGFSTTCTDCHTTNPGWKPVTFDHSIFPLTLAHSVPGCADCHKGNYTNLPPACWSCHQNDYNSTVDPNHAAAGFQQTCADCHTTNPGWKPASYNHSIFPLTQGHSGPSCAECHKGNYTNLSPACWLCHQSDYNSTSEPNHSASGFPHTCEDCHNTNPGWKPALFDHSSFPLTQAHSVPSCTDCHKGNYTNLSPACWSCHQADYNSTTDPNHATAGFSQTCSDCHTTNPGWKPASYNHGAFPLTLGHSVPSCADCHKGNYTNLSSVCWSCHQSDYNSTADPNHSASGFPQTCDDCHTTNPGWKPASFDHSSFPLTQGHSVPSCSDCHKGNYTNLSSACWSCHQGDYNSTSDPNHATAGFAQTCSDCHTTNPGWKPASYNHSVFPLTLGHSVPSCADCHKGNYTNLSSACWSCHQADYNSTTDPNHSASGYPQTCADCHTTNPGWKPASFTHTSFPLTQGHAGPSCADCHKGNYVNTPTDCYSCHKTDYNQTVNPGHQALGFSTTCTGCHTTVPGWKPATYRQHDSQFPIYSGKHQGQWSTCADCHTNLSNYSAFSCITCHEHNKTDMDDKHLGEVSGYVYNATSCYNCHPTGRAE
jgi:hypothetical protein